MVDDLIVVMIYIFPVGTATGILHITIASQATKLFISLIYDPRGQAFNARLVLLEPQWVISLKVANDLTQKSS